MYETSFSISKFKGHWLPSVDKLATSIAAAGGIVATETEFDRVVFDIACPDECRERLLTVVNDYLADCFLVGAKEEYIKKNLKLKIEIYDILLRILIAFDRETEKEILAQILSIDDGLSVDGYFYFRLEKLRSRWDEICALAKENAFFLSNRETMFELLRFLMSTIKPKIERISVCKRDEQFRVYDTAGKQLASFDSAEQLMSYFIEVAPLQISMMGDILPPPQKLLLENIFEDKIVDA